MIFGNNPFKDNPKWNTEGTNLAVEKTLSYLGAEKGGPTNKCHIEQRLRCARRSFYSLQSAGLKYLGVSPETAMTILKQR